MKPLEEPTPCPGCKKIVELQDMRCCLTCRELFCPACFCRPDGRCKRCTKR